MLSTNQFRNGNHIDVDGTIFKIIEFQHVKPGKGGAFVRTKLRRASDGAVIDRTFRAGEKFRAVRTEVRRMQFLYRDGTDAHFMDTESYEQLTIPESTLADALRWMKDSEEVELLYIDGSRPTSSCRARSTSRWPRPSPGVRGDTASGGGTKPAVLETGARIQVPLFVNIGDIVRVDTRSGEYVSRPDGRYGRHMRRTEQRRAAVWALYQSDLLGRAARGDVPARRARASRAAWPASSASTSPSSTS